MSFFGEALELLTQRFPEHFEDLTVVLPDQHALPAFRKEAQAFARRTGRALLLPNLTTLHGFCLRWAGVRIPRRLTLLTDLHAALEAVEGERPFEKVKPLLEMMLSDFDELDSQLVDPELLFKSLVEETEIKARFSDYITEEEAAVIQAYWSHFSTKRVERHDQAQLDLYQKLPSIYRLFQARLEEKGYAYRGGMFRHAFHAIQARGVSSGGRVAFVGFNKLTVAQLRIMETYVQAGQGLFLADGLAEQSHTRESTYYQRKHRTRGIFQGTEAVQFLESESVPTQHNAYSGPGTLLGVELFAQAVQDTLKEKSNATVAILSTDNRHGDLLAALLADGGIKTQNLHRTSLAATPVFTLLKSLFDLYRRIAEDGFRKEYLPQVWLSPVLNDPVYRKLFDAEVRAFLGKHGPEVSVLAERDVLLQLPALKALGRMHVRPGLFWQQILSALAERATQGARTLVEDIKTVRFALNALEARAEELEVRDTWTFWTLFATELATTFLPADEEEAPVVLASLSDVQAQDFDYLFFLNATEGHLPTHLPRHSLIPLEFRSFFSITTPRDDAAQQAYLFFRLVKRAKGVWYFVNTTSSDVSTAEPSRYLAQLEHIVGQPIVRHEVGLRAQALVAQDLTVHKTPAIWQMLERYLEVGGPRLYPTQLGTYLQCPFKFYLSYIAKVRELEEVTEEMTGSRFGNILHQTMETLYKSLAEAGQPLTASALDALLPQVEGEVHRQVLNEYGFSKPEHIDELGYVAVSEQILVDVTRRLIERDRSRVPFVVAKLESQLAQPYRFPILAGNQMRAVNLDGKFDRADRLANGMVEIVDFKTGGKVNTNFSNWDQLFRYGTGDKELKEAFQILLYAWLLQKAEAVAEVRPTVVRIADLFQAGQEATSRFSISEEPIDSITPYAHEIEERLRVLLEEIFDPGRPFHQTADHNACRYCSFAGLCHRPKAA